MFNSEKVIQRLLSTKAHFGNRTPTSDFQPYLYGLRNEIAIIDLERTLLYLRRACNLIEYIIRSNGHILFVNTNPQNNQIIKKMAKETCQSYINHKWIGGFLTNWKHIFHVQAHFKHFENLSLKALDTAQHIRKVPRYKKMKKCFEGIVTNDIPDCLVIMNANQNSMAILEASQLHIPIVCLIDSDIPSKLQQRIHYPIPVNDDSLEFIYLFCHLITQIVNDSRII
uniref:Ribosomal protein S2 n=1 Tax=Nitella hyalina TaxID=181804 RepID=H9LSG6_NITHY|nr:ribosomal protein S2 [Nitella hyalina]AEH42849.1 ribosomal protein S2 [Nitella hyalina]